MTMQTETRIKLHAQGPFFNDGMDLDTTLAILEDFNKFYSYCVKKYQKKYAKDKLFFSDPQINISSVQKGSLLSFLNLDFPPPYVLIASEIANKSWELFKLTIEFAKFFISTVKKEKKAPEISIINSPNARQVVVCNFGSGPINIDKEVYDSFNNNMQPISSIAGKICPDKIESLDIEKIDSEHKKIDGIRFDNSNREDFIIEEKKIPVNEPMTFNCKVYSLNTRTKKGRLDIIGNEGEPESSEQPGIGFEIVGGEVEDYIAALSHDSVLMTAKYELLVSTLGKSKITYLYPTSIILP